MMLPIGRKQINLFLLSPSHRRGFTMIELILVVLLIGVLLVLSIPQTNTSLASTRIKQAADVLVNDVRWAQNMALTHGCTYALKILGQHEGYQLIPEEEQSPKKIRKLPQKVTIEASPETFVIYPDGSIDKVEVSLKQGAFTLSLSSGIYYGKLMVKDE